MVMGMTTSMALLITDITVVVVAVVAYEHDENRAPNDVDGMGVEMAMKVVFMVTIGDMPRLLIRLRNDVRHIIDSVFRPTYPMMTERQRLIRRSAHLPLRCSHPQHRRN